MQKLHFTIIKHTEIIDEDLRRQIRRKQILFGGNMALKIYGTLNCKNGRQIKKQNRVFFVSEKEALENGYRPCGACIRSEYKKWKDGTV
ncbi:MAG TPA: Ada metal-binding domain-containing protein [Chitinophagaceae bacterium]|nr:Ada metal-binding domain-containing protein [Chitinophagaceae bacterium]